MEICSVIHIDLNICKGCWWWLQWGGGGGAEKFVIDTYGENLLTATFQPFVLPLYKTGDHMVATGRCFAQR